MGKIRRVGVELVDSKETILRASGDDQSLRLFKRSMLQLVNQINLARVAE